MTNQLPNDAPRRVQFTVRAFFAAAILVSLFAAASVPGVEIGVFSVAFLV